MASTLAQAASEVVEILSPLASEDRLKVVSAALTLLGEQLPEHLGHKRPGATNSETDGADLDVPKNAQLWMKKHGLNIEQLEDVFHFDNGKAVLISLPGDTKKKIEQVEHTYLLQGVASLLSSGDASFGDDEARERCEHFGCYDTSNHSKYMKFGNKITGSKSSGWKLTAPGLSAAAELIKAA